MREPPGKDSSLFHAMSEFLKFNFRVLLEHRLQPASDYLKSGLPRCSYVLHLLRMPAGRGTQQTGNEP